MVGLQILRKHRRMTQKELGDASGIHLNTVNRYEAGTQFPESFERVKQLASALDCEVWQLFHPDPLHAMEEKAPPPPPNPELANKLLAMAKLGSNNSKAWSQQRRSEPEDQAEIA